ncbi:aldehyde dehydrogenase [Guyanagaster necrorhizus]|uniref:Aldehyde dehydrogenase n=1 Tax=Guyanagaster necrorhizus TaxID=856835 RepID=A0A9P7W423_9AGAR|nr:aldehyde dehydrogenase [Guyanagaster necrorhizus MCA 3950]KAG7451590.1 aldehyde dehydrogenase [Guyanagaster necrorhizus MCA 3950]
MADLLPFTQLYINGEFKASAQDAVFDVRNPYTGQVSGRSASATSQDCRDAIDAAHRALPAWESTDISSRQTILLKAADILQGSWMQKCIEINTAETGATPDLGALSWVTASSTLRTVAAMTGQLKEESFSSATGGQVIIKKRAVGVVLSIVPWNGPLCLAIRAVAAAIFCGNTVVLKASEYSPRSHALVPELFHQAGLPKGVLNFVAMSKEITPSLISDMIGNPKIRLVNFTGSAPVAKALATEAAKHLIPCIFELGGKNPSIVLNDADVEAAAKSITFGAMFNAGQVCISTERVIVQRDVSKALITAVVELCKKLTAGDPTHNSLPALFTQASAENVIRLIQDAVSSGAELLLGDLRKDGSIVQPHLLTNVTREMSIWKEETFGPVAVFMVCDTIDEAIELANNTEYSLTAAVWTQNLTKGKEVTDRLYTGFSNINGCTIHGEPSIEPFGLGGSSGYGRFDIDHFTQKRVCVVHAPGAKYPIIERLSEE